LSRASRKKSNLVYTWVFLEKGSTWKFLLLNLYDRPHASRTPRGLLKRISNLHYVFTVIYLWVLAQYTIGPVPFVEGSFEYFLQQQTENATTRTRKISDPLATAAIILPPPSIISSSLAFSIFFGGVKAKNGNVGILLYFLQIFSEKKSVIWN